MKTVLMIGCVLALVAGANTARADTIATGDGEFTNWSFSQVVAGGPDASNYATMTTTVEGSNAIDVNTTHSVTSGKSVWGVGIYDGFIFDPGASGSINQLSMSIDFKSGPGAFGQGQSIRLVLLQGGRYYGLQLGTTGVSWTWAPFTGGPVGLGDVTASWVGTSFDATPQAPDFSVGGAPIKFGFAAGNHISNTLTNYYDNWSVTVAFSPTPVPEPSTLALFGLAATTMAYARRRRSAG